MQAVTAPTAANPNVARAMRAERSELIHAVATSFEHILRWKKEAELKTSQRAEYLEIQFAAFVDYLIEYAERGDATFKNLFIGETIKALYDPNLDAVAARRRGVDLTAALNAAMCDVLLPRLSADAWRWFRAELDDVARVLTAESPKTQRVLLVGDCLFLDIVPFIVADLLEAGITLLTDYATSKEPTQLHDQLRCLSTRKFDLVFFSPFSYEFSPEYSRMSEYQRAFASDAMIRKVVDASWTEARQTIDLLADLFDGPVHVHNSSAVIREESNAKRIAKQKATARVRHAARAQVNERLEAYVAEKNASTFLHLFVFDEIGAVDEAGEYEAGAYFYKSALQHPAMLGRLLARDYVDLIIVNAWLMKKKVVVCDLDNTLWDGVIGEGDVEHFHDRQATLKELKAKGVVLAINSKNEPANVHWTGGTLCDDDFVHSAVSWDPKVQGMRRIQAALNLKTKDYVFIDDRADERELMRVAFPEVLCLDPTSPDTWRRIKLWASELEHNPDMNRTLMYRQREERKAFIKEDVSSESERAEMFAGLGLELAISVAQTSDLKRVAELINRTNQFNLEGSRTTLKEVMTWSDSPDHLILLGRTADRFGDMGTTCIAVARFDTEHTRILPFVLSCRVFGYGIERAVMNHLKTVAAKRGRERIVGRFVPTPQNGPCSMFFADNGFIEAEGLWELPVGATSLPDPPWLKVRVL
ncbi:MAG: HAD-IIIC family phosphatase [Ginsengibacter sp.]